jgi:hypothetical protein
MASIHVIALAIKARRAKRAASAAIRKPTATGKYAHAGAEPPMEEVLGDPIVHLVVRADRLEVPEVRRILSAAQRKLLLAAPGHAET